ncbi:uncharacterized protein KNAG_0E01310 [Huiozyma naganishii CBS 8797]|uniref:Uncharacterized protein n=1 Tax=Huiozyma naganishii (strain ATCC MYA-139 / BCRC 22969 / CBS 8797 / KCTC 17520 / NBRC 10181 / NCYC 3082 / Yp74L-3) TaxID=1071383 RepID=J7RYX7_HUIN7|nr:hypothetical protein KNAG_0E01310 [Kazachstania naganishii CBS 8797]CCK70397.1 hypothetical protein KNAG_0E01310 [Kazachstania naganishii CBS 8797]
MLSAVLRGIGYLANLFLIIVPTLFLRVLLYMRFSLAVYHMFWLIRSGWKYVKLASNELRHHIRTWEKDSNTKELVLRSYRAFIIEGIRSRVPPYWNKFSKHLADQYLIIAGLEQGGSWAAVGYATKREQLYGEMQAFSNRSLYPKASSVSIWPGRFVGLPKVAPKELSVTGKGATHLFTELDATSYSKGTSHLISVD